ncbi:zinc ribbon domain-containing protein [Butyricimonas faecihominis]|uniref:zinc ribbon domain-containing protein n=1 Tax=Butyricimonas faecihominis TaxID=1472416 RepID=UPI0032BF3F7A
MNRNMMVEKKICPFCGEENTRTAKKCSYCGKWFQGNNILEKGWGWAECFYCVFALIFVLILGINGFKENTSIQILYSEFFLYGKGIVPILCLTILWILVNMGLWSYCKMKEVELKYLFPVYMCLNIIVLFVEIIIYIIHVANISDSLMIDGTIWRLIYLFIILLSVLLVTTGFLLGLELRKKLPRFKNGIGYIFILGYIIPCVSCFIETGLTGTIKISILLTTFTWIYSLSALFLFFFTIDRFKKL